jgi:hypothetical protein
MSCICADLSIRNCSLASRFQAQLLRFQYLGAVIGVATVLALGFVQMANHVSDPGIKNLTYAAAAIAAFPAGTWAVVGITGGLYCSKVLRQAEAD